MIRRCRGRQWWCGGSTAWPAGAHQDFSRFCFRVAWPSAEWGSIPIEGGVAAAYRREIEAAEDPDAHRAEIEERLIALRSPFSAAEAFAVEDIIDPRDTRRNARRVARNCLRAAAARAARRAGALRGCGPNFRCFGSAGALLTAGRFSRRQGSSE